MRYVAINDGYDSNFQNNTNDFAPLKNVFNDIYCKDISRKVRSVFFTKQSKGLYLGTSAPFGYRKSPTQKGKLLIDSKTAPYVKRIFQEYLSGKALNQIVRDFTKERVPTPSEYSKIKNTQTVLKGAWCGTTIRRILKNPVYIRTYSSKQKAKNKL